MCSKDDEPEFNYTICRSPRRRTVSISVDSNAVVVRAPSRMPEKALRSFVEGRSGWVMRKLAEVKQRDAERPSHRYAEGEMLPYLGDQYRLVLRAGGRSHAAMEGDELVVCLRRGAAPDKIPQVLKRWYVARAREVFRERAAHYSALLGVEPAGISVRGQKRRWGSCSSDCRINLNWKLMTAPVGVLDYVVAHELCHIIQRNHSGKFWALLSTVIPEYRECRKWLRENGHTLGL